MGRAANSSEQCSQLQGLWQEGEWLNIWGSLAGSTAIAELAITTGCSFLQWLVAGQASPGVSATHAPVIAPCWQLNAVPHLSEVKAAA